MTSDQYQIAEIDWDDRDIPISRKFNDPYFSLENGLEETRHVFLCGNRLPGRFKPDFHIAELGFGSGLNLLATWHLWRTNGNQSPLHFTSFEAFPMAASDMEKSLRAFPELADLSRELLQHWSSGQHQFQLDNISATVILSDANQTLPMWKCKADAWFLDGFAPAKNPELWNADLMAAIAAHTNPDGTLATYTAAGYIRRSLSDVGFSIDRVPGFGKKRHMTIGQMKATK